MRNHDHSDSECKLQRLNSNTPGTVGRKNIRKVLTDQEVDEATRKAEQEEKERRKRIEERQKLVETINQLHFLNEKANFRMFYSFLLQFISKQLPAY